MNYLVYKFLAAAYDCGAYGSGDFGDGGSCSGDLAYTGQPWVIYVALVTALVVVSVSVLLWRKRKLATR